MENRTKLLTKLTNTAAEYKEAIRQKSNNRKIKSKAYKAVRDRAYTYLANHRNNQNIREVIINVEKFKNPRSGIMYEGGRAAGRQLVGAVRKVGWGPNPAPNGNTRAINRLGAGFKNEALNPEALNEYTKALRRITSVSAPNHANSINTIVKNLIKISNSKTKFENKPAISKNLGAALGRSIDKILSRIPGENEGPGQPTKEGAIIGEFFRGLLSQPKPGTIRWASRFVGGKFGNRHELGRELEKIFIILDKNPKTKQNGKNFAKIFLNLYQKWPDSQGNRGPKQPIGNRFINGIIDPGVFRFAQALASIAGTVTPVIKAFRGAQNKTLGALAFQGALQTVQQNPVAVANAAHRVAKNVGNRLLERNKERIRAARKALAAATTLEELKRIQNVNNTTFQHFKRVKAERLKAIRNG